jgi:3-hydroxyisobutyrate dehydrogenase-like beta-hydroxyacid dehydrogenase
VCALAAEVDPRGVHLLDAPVSGGRARSYAGNLTILIGGDADVIESARPVMATYGSVIARVGAIGSGQLIKSLNNYFYAAHLATAAKAIELIRALDLDVDVAAEVLPTCSGSSTAFAIQAARRSTPTAHDKGAERAGELLLEVVESLRVSARHAGVDLGLVDQLVDEGLRSVQSG